ncbi:hypothetical protein D3C81_518480 [compost metagenome]
MGAFISKAISGELKGILSSYSTTIASKPSLSAFLFSAATNAIESPIYLVSSPSAIRAGQSLTKCPKYLFPGISLYVNTATTPGIFLASSISMLLTSALGYFVLKADP